MTYLLSVILSMLHQISSFNISKIVKLTKMQMRVGSNICNSDKIFKEGIGQETNIPLVSAAVIAGNYHT